VSPGRRAERSLRHPGFAHSCILAFALRAALDCKAGSFGPGSPLAYGFKVGLSAAGAAVCGRAGAAVSGRQEAAGWVQAGRVFGCRRHLGFAEAASRPEDPSRSLACEGQDGFAGVKRAACPPQERRPAAGRERRSAAGGKRRGGCKRDGSSGAAGTSASPRPLRGPRTRPVPSCPCRAGPPTRGLPPIRSLAEKLAAGAGF